MNIDDESFLSAYMDGQLAPDQHQLVESALVANPHLADRLRGFTLLRDLVAGLPRDGSVDVSALVMREIQARSGRRRGLFPTLAGLRRGSRRILPLAGLAATAAGLMVAASLAILIQTSPIDRGGQQVAALGGRETVVPSNPPSIPPLTEAPANPGAPSGPSSSSNLEISGALAKGIVEVSTDTPAKSAPVAEAGEPLPNGDLEHVRRLLDDPSLKRYFVVRNGSRNNTEQQVASIVEHTTRVDFFKITVSQGIVIDPRRPDEATVFAFLVNPNQIDRFHEQLKSALPGLVELESLDPKIATQLTDIGKVGAFPPASLAEVEIPREALALRTNPREDLAPRAKVSAGTDRLHGEQIDPSRPSDAGAVARPPVQADKRVVVLVWVSRPPAG